MSQRNKAVKFFKKFKNNQPVKIWMKPKRMMMKSASSLEAVNKSWTLVAALTLMQFTKVSEATGVKDEAGTGSIRTVKLQSLVTYTLLCTI